MRLSLTTLLLLALPLNADAPPMPPQQQVSFTRTGAPGTYNLDWQGADHRVYFIQTTVDLVTWTYQPVIAFGSGVLHSVIGSNSAKFFVRLQYTDDPSITTLEQAENADFDHDGVSNLDEISVLGTNPFAFSTNGSAFGDGAQDWDGDGINNAAEVALGLDPGTSNTAPASGAAVTDYGYDDARRLVSATSPVSAQSYNPDEEGNLK